MTSTDRELGRLSGAVDALQRDVLLLRDSFKVHDSRVDDLTNEIAVLRSDRKTRKTLFGAAVAGVTAFAVKAIDWLHGPSP